MANMNGAEIQSYITQNYPQLGQLSNQQIQTIQNNAGGGQQGMLDQAITTSPEYQQYQTTNAQNTYQQGINTAVSGLQGQQTNLQQSYGSLLADVMGQGSTAMNTATSGENAYLASRGLVSQSGLGNNQLSQAQLAVQAQNQAASGSVGLGSASDINAIQQAIAGIQAGAAGTETQIPLQYGSLALSQLLGTSTANANQSESQLAQAQAQAAQYQPLAQGGNLYNISNGSVVGLSNILKSLGINIAGL